MSAHEPPRARGLRLSDMSALSRRARGGATGGAGSSAPAGRGNPDEEEDAFPALSRHRPRQGEGGDGRRSRPARPGAGGDEAGAGGKTARRDRDGAGDARGTRNTRGTTSNDGARPPVRHVMKGRNPGDMNAVAEPDPERRPLWRRAPKAAAAAVAPVTSVVSGRNARRAEETAPRAADPPAAASGGDRRPAADSPRPLNSPFSGANVLMLIPAAFAAYYGAGFLVGCTREAGGSAAFCLWLMMGFWIAIITAKWPMFRLLRWAWVLAGLMAAASIPTGGG